MAHFDPANLPGIIMRSNGNPGYNPTNNAGAPLTEKVGTAAPTLADHYKLPGILPPPPPPAPAVLASTCTHDMVGDTSMAGVAGLKTQFTAAGAGGDTVFLPFKANVISSAVLRVGLGAPDFFFTAELSGCCIFADHDTTAGVVIVYHANGMGLTPNAAAVQANWMQAWLPTPQTYMVSLYTVAHNSYLASYPNLVAVANGICDKQTYGRTIKQEIQRKVNQGRTKVDLLWGTNVFGVRNGANWDFYYQTFGGLEEYERPDTAGKRWTNGKKVVGRGAVKVWDTAKFCTA